jgi:hypothetical protein
MDTKLTLKLDKAHIDTAKRYATKQRTSLSSLVEKYFSFLADMDMSNDTEISPTVKKLSGILKLESDFELRNEKSDRLLEKYQ